LDQRDGLICAEVLYLGPGNASGAWEEGGLLATGHRHPARCFPDEGLAEVANPGLFWSLAFAIRRTTFARIGGFDERFTGYGAEDTDFGYAAKASGCPLYFLGGAIAFHQHHETFDPPVQHLNDIVANAIRYHRKWGWWPMDGWLQAFAQMGLVEWRSDRLQLLRRPTSSDLEACRCA
jgi:GT2 family glycosyltransferase